MCIFLQANSPAEFSQKCVQLLRNRDLRASLVENAHSRVQSRYDWNKIEKEFRLAIELCHKGVARD